jgi:hypothetical protein
MAFTPPSSGSASTSEHRLMDYLTSANPVIRPTEVLHKSKSNTRGKLWLNPFRVSKWEEFNKLMLTKCYNGVFSQMLAYVVEPYQAPSHLKMGTSFISEDGLEDVISGHTRNIVASALLLAQSRHEQLSAPYIEWVKGAEASRAPRKLRPDWAGIRRFAFEGLIPRNFLPGETKPSQKWKSDSIEPYNRSTRKHTPNWMWPIRQIFTYCIRLKVRYGYIITDKELVVCRVHTLRQAESPEERKEEKEEEKGAEGVEDGWIEYTAIKYNLEAKSRDEDELTMHLALWWLHLLAGHGGPVSSDYGPLEDEMWQPPAREAPDHSGDDFTHQLQDQRARESQVWMQSPTPEVGESSFLYSVDESNPNFSFRSIGPTQSFASSKASEKSTSRPKSGSSRIRKDYVGKEERKKTKKRKN